MARKKRKEEKSPVLGKPIKKRLEDRFRETVIKEIRKTR